jgi:hypothetical protein
MSREQIDWCVKTCEADGNYSALDALFPLVYNPQFPISIEMGETNA